MSEIVISPGWASYLRVSDEDKQTPERSFAFQRKHIQDSLLASSNVEFKREYCDMLTGTSPNRADYQQMLSDAQAGKFSHLGLYRADRFGRNAVEGLQAATKLISWGVKVRVANMPTLQPETPDGFFMFLLQMGLAQREVDVLRERTRDGMEAKMRMGGWPNKAPFGYVNKEKLVSSNKYDRWVEQDPNSIQVLKDAWDFLLTGRYTLDQICEELTQRGYTTYSGRPWAWNDPKTGRREYAANRLHKILHNPFYAGWVTSKRFGIVAGEVRGSWEAIITPNQFQKGVDILRKNGSEKSCERKNFYLLRGLLWAEVGGERYKLHGSTPSGRSQSYSYYITHAKPGGTSLHIPSKLVDGQMVDLLQGIEIDADLIPEIRKIYVQEVQQFTNQDRDKQVADMRQRLSQLKEEEARLGRLLITGKITEEAYDQLRLEWQEKLRNVELGLAEMERDAKVHLDDLDLAIGLLRELVDYYFWLEDKQKSTLLQILFKRLIVDEKGRLVDYELNSPFVYLRSLADRFGPPSEPSSGSVQVREGAYVAPVGATPRSFYSANAESRNSFFILSRSGNLWRLAALRLGVSTRLTPSHETPFYTQPVWQSVAAVGATPRSFYSANAESRNSFFIHQLVWQSVAAGGATPRSFYSANAESRNSFFILSWSGNLWRLAALRLGVSTRLTASHETRFLYISSSGNPSTGPSREESSKTVTLVCRRGQGAMLYFLY